MSTLPQIGIEFARLIKVSDEVEEKIVSPASEEYEEDIELTVTLTLTLCQRGDLEVLREMVNAPRSGAIEIYSSR